MGIGTRAQTTSAITTRLSTLAARAPRGVRTAAALVACALACASASAQTFSNSAPISIPSSGIASLYPSPINVSGVNAPIASVSVSINAMVHNDPSDLVILLVAPDGRAIRLTSRCGGTTDATGGTFTFVAQGAGPAITNFGGPGTTFATGTCTASEAPLPAPAANTTDLASFVGSNANGTWSLYVADLDSGSSGSIAGWSITFTAPQAATPSPNSFTYQGRITENGNLVSGPAFVTFRLFDAATDGAQTGPTRVVAVNATDGLFTTFVDFGPTAFDGTGPLWLQAEVNGVPVTPRQRVTATPLAFRAAVATLADSATSAITATTATTATSATIATTATTANSVPWSGITGIPANVSLAPWSAGTPSNSITTSRVVGIGGQPIGGIPLTITEATVGSSWQTVWINNETTFRGGARTSDEGFFEITNNAGGALPFFARLNSAGVWSAVSDARLKTNVVSAHDAHNALETALKLRPVFFDWLNSDMPRDYGLIAQEVREVFPILVVGDEDKGNLTVNYSQLSVLAIGAIQDLKAEVDTLRAENAELRARLEEAIRAFESRANEPAVAP
jgi:subtilisin-like proprotein convertase family protein